MNLGDIAKVAKLASSGSLGADELTELASTFGIEVEFQELLPDQRPIHFQEVARQAILSGSRVLHCRGRFRDGDQAEALLVMVPKGTVENKA